MTPGRAARKATSSSPRRSLRMNSGTDKQRKALGRGLSTLLPARATTVAPAAPEPALEPTNRLPIDKIEPNPMQPRTVFHPERLQELANSIRANGVIQPVIVRRAGARFQIVAGERRWRAAQLAGLTEDRKSTRLNSSH